MSSAKLVFVLAFSLIVSTLYSAKIQDTSTDGLSPQSSCANCTLCQYPCHAQPPPPPSGSQSYGAPPPPPPTAQVNCPPSSPVQCCQYSPPVPYYYNPYSSNYSGSASLVIKPCSSTWFSAIFFIPIILFGFDA